MSPERIDGKEYSFPADVWAFGLSMITIAQGRFPMDTQGGYWTILHGIRDAPPPSLPNTFSEECRDFVAQCMKRNPDERKAVKDLLKHPFLRRTVVEDLTYDQNYDRGKTELLSIVDAVYAHVETIKSDLATKSREEDFAGEKSLPYRRIFGDLESSSAKDILRYLLLGESPATASQIETSTLKSGAGDHAASGATASMGDNSRRRIMRPRLGNLAKQLHLAVDKVEMEVRAYLDGVR